MPSSKITPVEVLQSEISGMNPIQMGEFQRLLEARLPAFIQALAREARKRAQPARRRGPDPDGSGGQQDGPGAKKSADDLQKGQKVNP